MKSFLVTTLTALLAVSASGCATLQSVSITPIPADRSRPVAARSHDWVILGFKFNNDFVDVVRDDLQRQCPQGKVTGLMTKQETYMHLYLIIFPFWKRVVEARGYCVAG